MKFWKPILTLLIITPFLTELLSTNLLPGKFFGILTILVSATIGYGFPVLLIREFVARKRINLMGMLFLGLAYGIYNEGIIAKTFFLKQGVPIAVFDNYIMVGGIEMAWAITISLWHALFAVVFPIFIVYFLFPKAIKEKWLGRSGIIFSLLITILGSAIYFFGVQPDRPAGTIWQYIILITAIIILCLIALKNKKNSEISQLSCSQKYLPLRGFFYYVFIFFTPIVLSGIMAPWPVFIFYAAVMIGLTIYFIHKSLPVNLPDIILFGLGAQIAVACFGLFSSFNRNATDGIISSIMFILIFLGAIYAIKRKCYGK